MPLALLLPCAGRVPLPQSGSTTLGREHLRAWAMKQPVPEVVTRCSKKQCRVDVIPLGGAVTLQHIGEKSRTLVTFASGQEQQLAHGESVRLVAGDSVNLLPECPAAIQLVEAPVEGEGEQQEQQDGQQQQLQQQQHRDGQQQLLQQQQQDEELQDRETQETPHQQGTQQQPQQQQQQGLEPQQPQPVPQQAGEPRGGQEPPDQQPQPPSAGAAAAGTALQDAGAQLAGTPPPAGGERPVMLILVGLPGSGKSTFALELERRSGRQWVRVNQDSISGPGKKGTREACIKAARLALGVGKNAVIDRCNLSREQRGFFTPVAAQRNAAAHCLLLDVDAKVCAERAKARTGHEGGVEGPKAARVVYQNTPALNDGRPDESEEGFASVTTAKTPAQVEAELQRWAAAAVGKLKPPGEARGAAAAAPPAPLNLEPAAARPASQAAAAGAAGGAAATTASAAAAALAAATAASAAAEAAVAAAADAGEPPSKRAKVEAQGGARPAERNAFSALMAGARQQAKQPAAAAKAVRSPSAKARPGAGAGSQGAPPAGAARGAAHGGGQGPWSQALVLVADDPEGQRGAQAIWHVDDQLVGIEDKYPKARHHALLVARRPGLDRVGALGRGDVPLLQHMRRVALGFISQRQGGPGGSSGGGGTPQPQQPQQQEQEQPVPPGWRLGFHALPSMHRLHLHVVSDDFDSDCLKNKKHWNSFTHGDFFVRLDDALEQLLRAGAVRVDEAAAAAALQAPLRCHRCGAQLGTMPQLKVHIAACRAEAAPRRPGGSGGG